MADPSPGCAAARNRSLLAFALASLVAACGDTRSRIGDDGAEAAGGAQAAPAAASPAPIRSGESPAADGARLALEGEGLRVFLVPSGSARPIAFGMPAAAAMRILSSVQGGPPRDRGENLDCGATFAVWDDGLTVWFSRDRFAGWSVGAGSGTLKTASGVGVGSTRRELEAAYEARVGPSTLGMEFTAGGLAGLLESARPDGRVTHLWAGTSCVAR